MLVNIKAELELVLSPSSPVSSQYTILVAMGIPSFVSICMCILFKKLFEEVGETDACLIINFIIRGYLRIPNPPHSPFTVIWYHSFFTALLALPVVLALKLF